MDRSPVNMTAISRSSSSGVIVYDKVEDRL